jgi:membrane protease YdiL (CAAX protease family)
MAVERAAPRFEAPPDVYLGAFVVITLVVSWSVSLLIVTDSIPGYATTVLMLTPAVIVLALRRIQGQSVFGTIASSIRGATIPSLGFAFLYPVLFIGSVGAIALASGLGVYQPGPQNFVVIEQFGFAVLAVVLFEQLVRMYGEELGWRGYLLPALTEKWGTSGCHGGRGCRLGAVSLRIPLSGGRSDRCR